jgi:uncharacterized membrane protein YdbT with pleckstrin-like domain
VQRRRGPRTALTADLLYNTRLAQSTRKDAERTVVVRPSTRVLKPFYTAGFLLVALVYGFNNNRTDRMDWLIVFPALLLAWTLYRHFRLRFVTLKITSNKLRYETGMLSRTTRTMELAKIQDVHVSQTMMQRLLGIGDLTIETAGESGPLTMHAIDNPHEVGDFILESARK